MPTRFLIMQLISFLERFSFYSILCILVFFLTSLHKLSIIEASIIFSLFLALNNLSSFLSLIIFKKYKNGLIPLLIGSVLSLSGYLLFYISFYSIELVVLSLFLVSTGSGLFKNLLQITTSGMFDKPEFNSKIQAGFNRYFRIINMAAFIAPVFVSVIINLVFFSEGLVRNDSILYNCETLIQYATHYEFVYMKGLKYSLLIPAIALSLVVMLLFRNKTTILNNKLKFPHVRVRNKLGIFDFLFVGTIYFFIYQQGFIHQLFARDLILNDQQLLPPEMFLSINPLFILLLQPLIMKLFDWLQKKDYYLNIGFFMKSIFISIIIAYLVLAIGTFDIGSYGEILFSVKKMNIFWLIGSYFFLSIADILFHHYPHSIRNLIPYQTHTSDMNKSWFLSFVFGSLFMLLTGIIIFFINNISIVMFIYASTALIALIVLFYFLSLKAKKY